MILKSTDILQDSIGANPYYYFSVYKLSSIIVQIITAPSTSDGCARISVMK